MSKFSFEFYWEWDIGSFMNFGLVEPFELGVAFLLLREVHFDALLLSIWARADTFFPFIVLSRFPEEFESFYLNFFRIAGCERRYSSFVLGSALLSDSLAATENRDLSFFNLSIGDDYPWYVILFFLSESLIELPKSLTGVASSWANLLDDLYYSLASFGDSLANFGDSCVFSNSDWSFISLSGDAYTGEGASFFAPTTITELQK